jgi:hypothetical protein
MDRHEVGYDDKTYNPSIWEAEAGKSEVPGQPGLYSETLSQTPPPPKKKSGSIYSLVILRTFQRNSEYQYGEVLRIKEEMG